MMKNLDLRRRSYVSEEKSLELRIGVDVGYRRHSVAMGALGENAVLGLPGICA